MQAFSHKKSDYYNGSLSDGDNDIRIEVQHQQLLKFKETKEPVNIIDHEIKKSRGGDKVEVMVKQCTEITSSV